MSTIDIRRKNTHGKAAAREKTEHLAARMKEKFGLNSEWQGDVLGFEAPKGAAKGTKGKIHLAEDTVRVEVDLPLLLRGFKGTVEKRIEEELDKLLA